MACTKKHIPCPIPDSEWVCPKCGKAIYIDTNYDCELYHSDDVVVCEDSKCGYMANLPTVIRAWAKRNSRVKCPCCNGSGWVSSKDTPTGIPYVSQADRNARI